MGYPILARSGAAVNPEFLAKTHLVVICVTVASHEACIITASLMRSP